jgi:rRNA maturation endonuclease Nob1
MSKKLSNKGKAVIADTSPLLLLLMGLFDENYIENFKRLSKYDSDDYDLLFQFVAKRKIIVTPHVLTEVSNFAKELKPKKFSEFMNENRQILEKINEKYIPKTDILASQEVIKFGFTDTSIILAAKENDALVLTDDYPLYGICKRIGLDTMHMTEIQSQREIFF